MLCVFMIAVFLVRKYQQIMTKDLLKCTIVPSILFAFFQVFGQSFQQTDSWRLIFENYRTVLKACFLFTGYTVLFIIIIGLLFKYLKKCKMIQSTKEFQWFTDNPEIFISNLEHFWIICICFIAGRPLTLLRPTGFFQKPDSASIFVPDRVKGFDDFFVPRVFFVILGEFFRVWFGGVHNVDHGLGRGLEGIKGSGGDTGADG